MTTGHRLLGTLVFSAACLLNPVPARAQAGSPDPATAKLAKLGNRCETGNKCPKVWVTSVDGVELRGIVRSVGAAGLVFETAGERRTLSLDGVGRVQRVDTAADGLVSGFGLGALLGYLAAGPGCLDDNDCEVGVFPLVTGAILGGLWGGVDALHKGRETVYAAPGRSTTVRIAPVVGRHRLGFQVSLRR